MICCALPVKEINESYGKYCKNLKIFTVYGNNLKIITVYGKNHKIFTVYGSARGFRRPRRRRAVPYGTTTNNNTANDPDCVASVACL